MKLFMKSWIISTKILPIYYSYHNRNHNHKRRLVEKRAWVKLRHMGTHPHPQENTMVFAVIIINISLDSITNAQIYDKLNIDEKIQRKNFYKKIHTHFIVHFRVKWPWIFFE